MNESIAFLSAIPDILEQLHIMDQQNNNEEMDESAESDIVDDYNERRSVFRRSLAPSISSLENSLVEHVSSSVPSLDEIVIRQRGRRKQPAKISWSPIKSPFKTPTKKCSSLHMSLMSPSPAKKLFNMSSPMKLRSSPRKRIFVDPPSNDPSFSSTPLSTPTKRLKLLEDRSMNAAHNEVPMRILLKGLNQDQLIQIICDMSAKNATFEAGIRRSIPLPDIRAFEDQLSSLRKNVIRSSPRSRLLSRTDGAAFSRASPHLNAFKKSLYNHCKILSDSQHFDALIDYILMSWTYVVTLPSWDEAGHNILRRECFKILTANAKAALKNGGMKLGPDRVHNFQSKLKMMVGDYEDIGKCHETLNFLAT